MPNTIKYFYIIIVIIDWRDRRVWQWDIYTSIKCELDGRSRGGGEDGRMHIKRQKVAICADRKYRRNSG